MKLGLTVTLYIVAVLPLFVNAAGERSELNSKEGKFDFATKTLADGEGILLITAESIGYGSRVIKSIIALDEESGHRITIPTDGITRTIVVNAGSYKPVGISFIKDGSLTYKSIKTTAALENFQVIEGTVNYLGNWSYRHKQRFSIGYNTSITEINKVSVNYKLSSVKQFALENTWVESYPLAISGGNGNRLALLWAPNSSNSIALS